MWRVMQDCCRILVYPGLSGIADLLTREDADRLRPTQLLNDNLIVFGLR
jgi:hypothetical protein